MRGSWQLARRAAQVRGADLAACAALLSACLPDWVTQAASPAADERAPALGSQGWQTRLLEAVAARRGSRTAGPHQAARRRSCQRAASASGGGESGCAPALSVCWANSQCRQPAAAAECLLCSFRGSLLRTAAGIASAFTFYVLQQRQDLLYFPRHASWPHKSNSMR